MKLNFLRMKINFHAKTKAENKVSINKIVVE